MALTFLMRHLQEHFLKRALYGAQLGYFDVRAYQLPVDPPSGRKIRIQPERAVQYLHPLYTKQLLDAFAGAVQGLCTYQERPLAAQLLDGAFGDQTAFRDDADPIADLLDLAE